MCTALSLRQTSSTAHPIERDRETLVSWQVRSCFWRSSAPSDARQGRKMAFTPSCWTLFDILRGTGKDANFHDFRDVTESIGFGWIGNGEVSPVNHVAAHPGVENFGSPHWLESTTRIKWHYSFWSGGGLRRLQGPPGSVSAGRSPVWGRMALQLRKDQA